MELIADRGRRVTVEELNTTRLLAHARKQAQQRKLDDILIVDVDAHHYENECMDDILPFLENDVDPPARGRRPRQGPRQPRPERGDRVPGHGRAHHALSAAFIREDREGQDARRPARPPLDGRHERRLFLPVPDADALHRPAPRARHGGRAVLGLQPLADRKGAAGIRRALLFHAQPAAGRAGSGDASDRDVCRPQGRHRLHDHLGARRSRCTTTST